MRKGLGRAKLRQVLLISCVAGVAATPLPAQTVQGVSPDVSPLYGKINPFYGDVNAAYGKINPFYGKINPFYGKINPFFGDVTGFWGKINPFTRITDTGLTSFYGKTDPFWGNSSPYSAPIKELNYGSLNGFWSGQFANWNTVMTAWSTAQTSTDAAALASKIQTGMVTPTVGFWSNVASQYPNHPNAAALVKAQLAAAGVGFNADGSINGNSLLAIAPSQRGMLFLNVYDQMMDFAGTGHIDWWMGAVGWSPALAKTQGTVPDGRVAPTVGMIDFAVQVSTGADGKKVKGAELSKQIVQYGSTVFDDGHGAAVGSLIMGAVDGSGVLGVMPAGSVKVAVYDPYDASGTTNWTDVGTGIATLSNLLFKDKPVPVGVLNASLGVPGWTLNPGWNDALKTAGAHGHNLVIAAGNDGSTQTQNVPWNFSTNPNLIIVGSVGADGTISNFSNRPGEACLDPSSIFNFCSEQNKLKYRFIVAPGELILVSDGLGGHMRQSGTSLAAPLVSGAIAMLQNRWPWLSNYADETASIILDSATPKGTNPGKDPVYGVGELNIAAANAPLDWSKLVYFPMYNGKLPATVASLAQSTSRSSGNWGSISMAGSSLFFVKMKEFSGTQSSWDANGASYVAFERVGDTYRDFDIPLSSKLVGLNVTTLAGGQAYQSYLSMALRAQTGHFALLDANRSDTSVFANGFERSSTPAGTVGDMRLGLTVTPTAPVAGFRSTTGMPYETGATLMGENGGVTFGFGNGAAALDTSDSFTFRSDHELGSGGANPVLGLASGGSFLGGRMTVLPRLSIGVGTTQRSVWRNPMSFGIGAEASGSWVNRYAASAQTVNVSYALTPRFVAHAGVTHLREQSALLGIQSLSPTDLSGGSSTDATSMGFDLRLRHGLTLSGSGTVARTRASGGQLSTNGLTGTSAELAITKSGLLARNDQLRLMAATPLHTVGGHLAYSSVGVVDRQTGEIGIVTQSVTPTQGRMPLTGEVLYGRRLAGTGGEISLFGRVERTSQLTATDALGTMGGVQFQIAF